MGHPSRTVLSLATLFFAASSTCLSACDVEKRVAADTCLGPADVTPGNRGFLVVSGVYQQSSNVSAIGWDRRVLVPSLLSSGSKPVGLTTTLSGDVVAPTHPSTLTMDSVIIDRTNSVITWMDASTCGVRAQLQVERDPQDYLEIDAHHALVPRYYREGDIVVVDPTTAKIAGTIALPKPPAPAAGNNPTFLLPWSHDHAATGGGADVVLVTLQRFASSFADAATATIAAIDPSTLSVAWTLELTGMKNCGSLVELADRRVVVACTGVLQAPLDEQLAHAGLVVLKADGDRLVVEKTLHAKDLGNQPIFQSLAVVDGSRVVFLSIGNDDTMPTTPDRWLVADVDTGALDVLATSAKAFKLGSVLCSKVTGQVQCAGTDQVMNGGVVRWFHLEGTKLIEDAPIAPDPFGQAPQNLGPL